MKKENITLVMIAIFLIFIGYQVKRYIDLNSVEVIAREGSLFYHEKRTNRLILFSYNRGTGSYVDFETRKRYKTLKQALSDKKE